MTADTLIERARHVASLRRGLAAADELAADATASGAPDAHVADRTAEHDRQREQLAAATDALNDGLGDLQAPVLALVDAEEAVQIADEAVQASGMNVLARDRAVRTLSAREAARDEALAALRSAVAVAPAVEG